MTIHLKSVRHEINRHPAPGQLLALLTFLAWCAVIGAYDIGRTILGWLHL